MAATKRSPVPGEADKLIAHQARLLKAPRIAEHYHRRFRQWLARFNGVASRYLPNYLGWQWAVDGRRIASAEGFLRIALGPSNTER